MPIINRDLSQTQQRVILQQEYAAAQLVNGSTNIVGMIPFPCSVDFAQSAANGVSGSPVLTLFVQRFIVGSGFTSFALGTSSAVRNFGTSGVLANGISIPQIGSTVSTLAANDLVVVNCGGGTGAASVNMTVSLVLRPLQDIIQYFGVI